MSTKKRNHCNQQHCNQRIVKRTVLRKRTIRINHLAIRNKLVTIIKKIKSLQQIHRVKVIKINTKVKLMIWVKKGRYLTIISTTTIISTSIMKTITLVQEINGKRMTTTITFKCYSKM